MMGTSTMSGQDRIRDTAGGFPRGAVAAACGVAGAVAGIGAAELLAGLFVRLVGGAGTPSPLVAVGSAFIDATPPWLKDWAVATFGSSDKLALGVGMALTLLVAGALVGWLGARSRRLALSLYGISGLAGAAAVVTRPGAGILDWVPTLVGIAVGARVLGWLLGRLAATNALSAEGAGEPALSRRVLLRSAVGIGALGAAAILAGQTLLRATSAIGQAVAKLVLPKPARTVEVPPAATSTVAGQTPYLTPNDGFYRIDTALFVPEVDPSSWRLRVTGLVENEIEMTLDDLLAEDHVEALVTLACVSNTVGGDLAGNAVWTGWPVRELLARAGVRPEADMVLSRSVDGFTAGTPLEALTDGRDALIAVGMNGEPLPPAHGFPVRLVVPGLYGYVSATKWLTELKVTRFDADEGYWTPRGWSALGPIKTASRIDVPRSGKVEPDADGNVVVAGVAWAQHRGISKVEVQVDDGDWQEADLRAEPSTDAWRLWTWMWTAPLSGAHTLTVRATDGTGETQTSTIAPPAPDGSSGWHSVNVEVR